MKFRLAKCCSPQEGDEIVAFLKQDEDVFSVHRADCVNIRKVPPDRLVTPDWGEISEGGRGSTPQIPDSLLNQLDEVDIAVLRHHREMGVDYAAVVANHLGIDRAEVFTRHRKLRGLGLLRRVEPRMIRYRKGIADGKWIKHRNHTYYELTSKGRQALDRWGAEHPG